ncbi:hypothetical protein FKM82_013172 [Ascaphus truei]
MSQQDGHHSSYLGSVAPNIAPSRRPSNLFFSLQMEGGGTLRCYLGAIMLVLVCLGTGESTSPYEADGAPLGHVSSTLGSGHAPLIFFVLVFCWR